MLREHLRPIPISGAETTGWTLPNLRAATPASAPPCRLSAALRLRVGGDDSFLDTLFWLCCSAATLPPQGPVPEPSRRVVRRRPRPVAWLLGAALHVYCPCGGRAQVSSGPLRASPCSVRVSVGGPRAAVQTTAAGRLGGAGTASASPVFCPLPLPRSDERQLSVGLLRPLFVLRHLSLVTSLQAIRSLFVSASH